MIKSFGQLKTRSGVHWCSTPRRDKTKNLEKLQRPVTWRVSEKKLNIMKKTIKMKTEKLTSKSDRLFDRQLFGTQASMSETIQLDARMQATELVADLNRNITILPHRYCQ